MKQGRRVQRFILPHWWTSVIWSMPSWRQSTKNTKVELYSEAILWKMIPDLMQYSLNRDHQHLKWQQQKSLMSNPDCQGAQDKQLTQYLLISRSSMEDPVVPLERNLYGHILASLWWEKQFEKILLKYGWEKVFQLEMLIRTPWKGSFLSVYVDDIKLAGKKQNLDPMWKILNKEVDLGEPTSFLDHVYLGCTQRQCEISKDIVDNYRTMFESRISAGATEKLPWLENLRISSWSYDMEGHAKKCVERYCELANKKTQQLYKVSTPCIDDHHFKEEELKSVGELANVCSQIVLKCFILGTYWKTWYSLVSEQTWTIDHKMDQSLWQTSESIDILHPSHMWIQTVLLCGKHC